MELDSVAGDAGRGVGAGRAEIVLGRRDGSVVSVGAWGGEGGGPPDEGSSLSTPLTLTGAVVGALDVHRTGATAWSPSDLRSLARCADRAAAAARSAALAERQARQLAGIERSLVTVRKLNHEHANRLHTLGALTAMGEEDEARHFLAELLEGGEGVREAGSHGIEDPFLTGLLAGETEAAGDDGIALEIDRVSRLRRLPGALADTGWAALVGSLLEFAFEGAAEARADRRRVTFGAWMDGSEIVLRAHDPVPLRVPHSLRGVLLREAADAAGGTLAIEAHAEGTLSTVRVPA